MKKYSVLAVILMVMMLLFLAQCGKNSSSEGHQGHQGHGDAKDAKDKKGKEEKIDVDKLDIPDRLKEAIKSGRIPKERVKEILARRKEMAAGNIPTVEIETVKRKQINAFLVLNGVVEPERKVEVYSRLPAYVKEILKEEGDLVRKNNVLAMLDDTEIRINHRQAELQLEQAQLTLKDEETNFQRSRQLKETEMISDQDYQLAQSNYNKAKLDYQDKLENFKDLELQLNYTKIISPVDGYVTERLTEVGDRVNANQQVYTVEDFSPLLIKVYVPTSDVVNLAKGMETEVSTNVLAGRVFNGKIKLINPRIDVQSGTVKVTIEVFDNTLTLKPGMFVETKILIRNTPDALVIPRKSITYKQDQSFVFVLNRSEKGPQVQKRLIKIGITEDDNVEVTEGLEQDERIVTVGIEGLKDGMTVNIQGMEGMRGRRGMSETPPPTQERHKAHE